MKWLKRALWALVVVAVVGAIALSFRPEAIMVDTAKVERRAFVETIEVEGKTRVRERYVVAAPLGGKMARLGVHVGDVLEEGASIVAISPLAPSLLDDRARRELESRVGAAEAAQLRARAEVDRADAASKYAASERDKAKALSESGAVAKSELDRAELAARTAEKDLEAARLGAHVADHELETARAAVATTTAKEGDTPQFSVRAPAHGRVIRVARESEGPIAPGEPILELADPAALEVVLDTLSSDATRMSSGARVAIEGWGGDAVLDGRVRLVEPAAKTKVSALGVEEQRVDVVVDILSPPADWKALGDGYGVRGKVVVYRLDDATVAPASAVFKDGEASGAFAVEGGIARQKKLKTGRSDGRVTIVDEGLSPGDVVVVHPPDTVKDGARLKPR